MIIYYKLDALLEKRQIKKIELQKKIGCSPTTMANFSKNKFVSLSVIDKICKELNCQPGDIMTYVDDTKNAKKVKLEAQIAELQAKLKEIN